MAQIIPFPSPEWRVLLVDDSPGVHRLLSKLADATGIQAEIVGAETLDDALIHASEESWDLVILDNFVPPYATYEIPLRAIRAQGYLGPVALLSADAHDLPTERLIKDQLLGAFSKQTLCPKTLLQLRASTAPSQHLQRA